METREQKVNKFLDWLYANDMGRYFVLLSIPQKQRDDLLDFFIAFDVGHYENLKLINEGFPSLN